MKNQLRKGLVGLVAGAVIGFASSGILNAEKISLNPRIRIEKIQEMKQIKEHPEVLKNYQLIKNNIEEFSENYVKEIQKVSKDYKAKVEKNGIKKTSKELSKTRSISLEYAVRHLEGKIPEKDLNNMSDRFYQSLVKNAIKSKKFVDYNDEKLIKGIKKNISQWYILRVKHYRKLLKSHTNKEKYDYEKLLKSVYPTKKEYKNYIDSILIPSDGLYTALKKGLKWWAIGGEKAINKIRDEKRKLYIETIDKYYKKKGFDKKTN